MNYDVLIAGSGTAGAITAYALAKKGIKVALIDRKSDEMIGKKVCGDAIAAFHFDGVQKTGLNFPYPSGDELKQVVMGIDIYSPDMKTSMTLTTDLSEESGFLIDRHLFGQRIKNYAIDSGATLFPSSKVKGFIIENETIVGLRYTKKGEGETNELKSKVVVDATGANTILRKQVPSRYKDYIETEIAPIDMAYAYREIRKVKTTIENPERLRIIFDSEYIPSGYIWIFPRKDGTVNAGLGGSTDRTRNLKETWTRYLKKNPIFEGSELLDAGSGRVPTRRPLNSLVADNFALVGDSGIQVNPLHAGGLGINLESGVALADSIGKALENNDTSVKGLWNYNIAYMRHAGAGHAPLDLFRLLVARLDNNAINKIMAREIVSHQDIMKMSTPEGLTMSFFDKLRRLFKAIGILRPTIALAKTVSSMKKANQLYKDYPEIEGFQDWIPKVERLYSPYLKAITG